MVEKFSFRIIANFGNLEKIPKKFLKIGPTSTYDQEMITESFYKECP